MKLRQNIVRTRSHRNPILLRHRPSNCNCCYQSINIRLIMARAIY